MTETELLNGSSQQYAADELDEPDFGLSFIPFVGKRDEPEPTNIEEQLKLPDDLKQKISDLCQKYLAMDPEQLEKFAESDGWLFDFLGNATLDQIGTILMCASYNGHSRWIDGAKLIMSPVPPVIVDGELNALHVAILRGNSLCVKKLLEEKGEKQRQWLQMTFKGYTPLHLAVFSANLTSANAVFFAIRANFKEKSELAAELNRRSCLSPGYTPLHLAALKDVPGVVQRLIDAGADPEVLLEKTNHTPLHLAALSRNSKTAKALIKAGASLRALTNHDMTTLAVVANKTPKALDAVEPMLDACLEMKEDDKAKVLIVNFSKLQESPTDFSKSLLYWFVSADQRRFLQHPVCQILLDENWDRVRSWFYARLCVCFLATVCVTSYMVAFQACGCTEPNPRFNFSSIRCDKTTMLSIVEDCPSLQKFFMVVYNIITIMPLTIFEIVRKMAGFVSFANNPTTPNVLRALMRYSKQFENYFEWFCLTTTLCLFYSSPGQNNSNWAALVILLSWTNTMILQGQIPLFGVYVEMYVSVLKEFLKLLSAYVLLLLGFGISFFVLFKSVEPFSNPLKAVWKTFAMMTGELEYGDLLNSENAFMQNGFLSTLVVQMIFVAFLFTVAIVLMNLLVGVVVHDVNQIKSSALLTKLERKVELVVYLETTSQNIKLVLRTLVETFYCVFLRTKSHVVDNEENELYVGEYAQAKDRDFDSDPKNAAMVIAQLNQEMRLLDSAGDPGLGGKESHLERRLQRNQRKVKQVMNELSALVKEGEEIASQLAK